MADNYLAKLTGKYIEIYLDIIDIPTDRTEIALVTHEYINSPNNVIENLGPRTRRFTVNCIFNKIVSVTKGWNTQAVILPTYDALINLLEKINFETESLIFTHPKYGEISGKIESIDVYKDPESVDLANVTFEFLREIIEYEPKFVNYIIPQESTGFQETSAKAKSVIENDERDSSSTLEWTAAATEFRATLDAYLSTIENDVQSLIYRIDYGTSIPGLVLKDVNEAIDRVVQFYITARSAPASFVNQLIFGCRQLKGLFTGIEARIVHVMSASLIAYETAVLFDEDEVKRKKIDNRSLEETFDVAGNFKKGEPYETTLTINELENMLYSVREYIDEAIQLDRDNRSLIEQAKYLQAYVNEIKLTREKIVTVYASSEQSLFSILNQYDISYQYVDRILKLNSDTVINPNFAVGNIDIILPASAS